MNRLTIIYVALLLHSLDLRNYFNAFSLCSRTLLTAKSRQIMCMNSVSQTEDDGFSVSDAEREKLWSNLRGWFRFKENPGALILVRHGESEWNFNNTFTGWVDVDLVERGRREVEHAARLVLASGYSVDVSYTSRLKRAIRSTQILLTELNQLYRPIYKSWRLNERMYGALEGLSKPGTAEELGEETVQQWRAGLYARPPPMSPNHPYWHKNERKYADLNPDDIPITESLQDTMERTLPLWNNRILPDLKSGQNVLIMAHANSLRGIVKHIDNLSDREIVDVTIPNGIPLVYKFDKNMKPIKQEKSVEPLSGEFLEKKGLLRAALAQEAELAKHVPGYKSARAPPLDPVVRSLAMLRLEQKMVDLATGKKVTEKSVNVVQSKLGMQAAYNQYDKPVMVIIRHGQTEYNKLGLFAGWDDAPLAAEGREEAMAAGKLLKAHGIEFDVVYTSWLSRAIDTAWIILNELDSLWLPIVKSWRLNERMYGALTGMSKKMIAQRHGEEKYKKWRRSYSTRPPKISSFHSAYPGNDDRYVKYVKDVRVSVFESAIRSLAHGRLEIHRNFPKTESLKDCMRRTIPYYKNVIKHGSVDAGKNILIASSKNAIRGLLMHLCDIPEDQIHEIEIPTGLPLIYDYETKRIRLLDDGQYPLERPIQRHEFGKGFQYLFYPPNINTTCEISLKSYDPIIRLRNSPTNMMSRSITLSKNVSLVP